MLFFHYVPFCGGTRRRQTLINGRAVNFDIPLDDHRIVFDFMPQDCTAVTDLCPRSVCSLPLLLEVMGFEVLAHDGSDIDVLQDELTSVLELPPHMQGVIRGQHIQIRGYLGSRNRDRPPTSLFGVHARSPLRLLHVGKVLLALCPASAVPAIAARKVVRPRRRGQRRCAGAVCGRPCGACQKTDGYKQPWQPNTQTTRHQVPPACRFSTVRWFHSILHPKFSCRLFRTGREG